MKVWIFLQIWGLFLILYVFLTILYTLTFEILAVKCRHGVEVNWSRYRDSGVTDPALVIVDLRTSHEIVNLFVMYRQAKDPTNQLEMVSTFPRVATATTRSFSPRRSPTGRTRTWSVWISRKTAAQSGSEPGCSPVGSKVIDWLIDWLIDWMINS